MSWKTEAYSRLLGTHRSDVQRLRALAGRSPDAARIVESVFAAKLRAAGVDPDDPASFAFVDELPPGLMHIGTVLNGNSEGPVVALPEGSRDDIQHIGVFALTRGGKTYLMLHMASQHIEAGGPCWILDTEDEYSVLLDAIKGPGRPIPIAPDHLRISFFQPPRDTITFRTWMEDINLLLRQEMYLRDGSLNLFGAEMMRLATKKKPGEYPSLAEVAKHFEAMQLTGSKVRSNAWLESLINRFRMLGNAFAATANVTRSDMLAVLAERAVIFRLHGMRGIPLQFLTDYLLVWLSRYREANET